MAEAQILYERAGIQIIITLEKVTIKKNGLTIEIPKWVIDDFMQEFDKESAELNEILNRIKS